jgi:nucleoside-diphosphate-sugar epimerase
LHQKDKPEHDIYHLSSGAASQTFRQVTDALARARRKSGPVYMPWLRRPFTWTVDRLARGRGRVAYGASLMKVFLPYLVWNTVFDNTRVVAETGRRPVPFSEYSYPLLKFSRENHFAYKYQDWPAQAGGSAA